MERNPEVVVLFRTTEKKNKNPKVKPEWVSNINCLHWLKETSKDIEINVFGDQIKKPELYKTYGKFIEVKHHGNSESFLETLEYALTLPSETIVYFCEDDYMHRDGWVTAVKEGLERADYVSLYDHPDKYTGNPEVLFHTESTHWKYTHSTTMTFATKVKTLAFDERVFKEFITTGNPPDHHIFLELRKLGRRLATPIPGYSTHGESALLSPVIDWRKL